MRRTTGWGTGVACGIGLGALGCMSNTLGPLPLKDDAGVLNTRATGAMGVGGAVGLGDDSAEGLNGGLGGCCLQSGCSVMLQQECAQAANLPSDLNCSGTVSSLDVDAFVLALTNPSGYAITFPDCDINNADANLDGVITLSDIGPFSQGLMRDGGGYLGEGSTCESCQTIMPGLTAERDSEETPPSSDQN